MIYIVTQHFSLNRVILLLIGLWPYECSKLVQLQIILCFSILISSVVYQVVSFVLFFCMYVIEYNSFRVNRHTMKWSLEQLQRICNELKDEKEIDIMKKCGDYSRRYTTLIMWLNVCNIIAIILFPLVLYIFDTVLRINEYHLTINRLIQMLIPKHFVGRENYMYIIILHSGSTIMIGGIILVATMTMCVAYIKHACGMFRIASYRIEKAVAVNTMKNVSLENEIIMYREIIHAVDIHRKAIKATALFFSGFQRSRFVLLIIGVLTLSLNLYGVSFSNVIRYIFG
ncbi:uncharacterized protein LOC112468871 [Temnothorax curvispinosus]|uniref:Uncharacterized protein LOC112461805 n=1 Tax=Temnothorax curvispinosus TaxID=300111 RepID=A0A6J1QM11_9HYME|nr:uncharacterized protein LOC112461805 [Temnothorax curvispinosus]XP_024889555.1 uncharacterized protein LOC112465958 [Temnothorax curvispinosus]XP_024894011.1 uncharacterized protein LOC112468871 [Temnothorax curvispinosus]